MPSSAEALLVHQLECSRLLHQERGASAELAAALDRVAQWQARRLNATYADLAVDPRYAGAIAFFQSELYGPGDFSQRDADLARVVPIMIRVLPDAVVATVAMAMELSTLSPDLDHALVGKLEGGFASFAGMRDVDAFLEAINTRETALMEAIFAGDRAPFPDP